MPEATILRRAHAGSDFEHVTQVGSGFIQRSQPHFSDRRVAKMANRGYDVVVDVDQEVCSTVYTSHSEGGCLTSIRAIWAIPTFRTTTSSSTLPVSSQIPLLRAQRSV